MWIECNLNPKNKRVGDCVIRAIAKNMGVSWENVYVDVSCKGYDLRDMPSANHVWDAYLKEYGFKRYTISNTCPECYTIRDFAYDNPKGKYIVATGSHVVAVENGDYFDTWDSGDEVPIYYYVRESEV